MQQLEVVSMKANTVKGDAVPASLHEMTSNPAAPESAELEAQHTQQAGFEALSHSTSAAAFNKAFILRGAATAGSLLPLSVYTIACIGTAFFDPYYVLITAVLPLLTLGRYLARYVSPCPKCLETSQKLIQDSECYATLKLQKSVRAHASGPIF